jgi:hypothetical protein
MDVIVHKNLDDVLAMDMDVDRTYHLTDDPDEAESEAIEEGETWYRT